MDSGSGSESDDSSEAGIDDMTPEEIDAEIAFLQAEETSTALSVHFAPDCIMSTCKHKCSE